MFGGAAPDALAALVAMLATLRDAQGNTTIDGPGQHPDAGPARRTRPSSSAATPASLDGVALLGDGTRVGHALGAAGGHHPRHRLPARGRLGGGDRAAGRAPG